MLDPLIDIECLRITKESGIALSYCKFERHKALPNEKSLEHSKAEQLCCWQKFTVTPDEIMVLKEDTTVLVSLGTKAAKLL